MSTAPVCPPRVLQSSDGKLLAGLGALQTQLHATWTQMLSVIAKSIPGVSPPRKATARWWNWCGPIARVPRSEAQCRVDAAADVLPGRGLGGAPVGPRLPRDDGGGGQSASNQAPIRHARLWPGPMCIGGLRFLMLGGESAESLPAAVGAKEVGLLVAGGGNRCGRFVDLHAADGIFRVVSAAAETFALSVELVQGGESDQGEDVEDSGVIPVHALHRHQLRAGGGHQAGGAEQVLSGESGSAHHGPED